jgi:Subtilisin inhibitor-like
MLRRTATAVTATAAVSALASPALACPPSPAVTHGEKAAGYRLVIRYQEDEKAAEEKYILRCHPPGGIHPEAEAACDAVDKAVKGPRSPWEPVPGNAMCTQIYGGPHTARVNGVWDGRKIDAGFDRTNGCEIARWNSLVPALPEIE